MGERTIDEHEESLAGRRVMLVGKLASMPRREAEQIVRDHGGTLVERDEAEADVVVVRDDKAGMAKTSADRAILREELRARIASGVAEVISESELWTRLGLVHNAIGYSDESIELWLATGLDKREQKLDAGEFLEVFWLPFDEALAMAGDGRLSDVKTIVGLYWASLRR